MSSSSEKEPPQYPGDLVNRGVNGLGATVLVLFEYQKTLSDVSKYEFFDVISYKHSSHSSSTRSSGWYGFITEHENDD